MKEAPYFTTGTMDDPFWNFAFTPEETSECLEDLFMSGDSFLSPSELFDISFSPQDKGEILTTTDESFSTQTSKNNICENGNRSRSLVSERHRRSRMRDDLYALRSLVPNITKMDKASIVSDAVVYLQGLQMQANQLNVEIASLEASLVHGEREKNAFPASLEYHSNKSPSLDPITNKIYQIDVIPISKTKYYAKILSSKGKWVATFIHKALHLLTNISIQTSHLATSKDNCVFTFTFKVNQGEIEGGLPYLKVWIGNALVMEGFELELYQSSSLFM